MLLPWQTGKIIRIEQEAPKTRRFWIQLPGQSSFDFKPGQFVTLDLPIHEKPNKRWRSYSIASWPDGTNIFELVIVLLDGGAGTTYLFEQCSVGSELIVRGPQGVFTLPEPIEKDLFFICTGTGIAPFRSMVHFIYEHAIAYKNIYLIFGTRRLEDCLYREEMVGLQQAMPRFHYIRTLSQEFVNEKGCREGYVHGAYEEICKGSGCEGAGSSAGHEDENLLKQVTATVSTLPPAYFFLCGWKNMIDEAKERIQALGYDRKSIHQELYG